MNQRLLARRDELAHTYQLGALRQEHPPRLNAALWFGLGMSALLAVVLGAADLCAGTTLLVTTIVLLCIWLGISLFVGAICASIYLANRQYIAVYVHGFLSLRSDNAQVARWEQIRQVEELRRRGGLVGFDVHLFDGTSIRVGAFVAHYKALWALIERPLAPPPFSLQ